MTQLSHTYLTSLEADEQAPASPALSCIGRKTFPKLSRISASTLDERTSWGPPFIWEGGLRLRRVIDTCRVNPLASRFRLTTLASCEPSMAPKTLTSQTTPNFQNQCLEHAARATEYRGITKTRFSLTTFWAPNPRNRYPVNTAHESATGTCSEKAFHAGGRLGFKCRTNARFNVVLQPRSIHKESSTQRVHPRRKERK